MYELIFFISIFLLLYSYLVYPLILLLWSSAKKTRRPSSIANDDLPTITVVIAAHNEASVIEGKILNTLELDYPKDKIEILIGSDGSTDGTDDICRKFNEVRLVRIESRQGKANVLNNLVPLAKGGIILFSDANTILEADALRKMTGYFSDPSIGCVCGRLVLKSDGSNLESYEGVYWRFESKIKEMESRVYSTIGANGGIYAIRKELYLQIPANTIIDDFLVSLNILEQGKRVVFEKDAVAYEYISKSIKDEFWRKVRIGAGNLQVFIGKLGILKRMSPFVRFAYLSHKVFRWVVPVFLVALYFCFLKLNGQGLFTYLFLIYNACIITAILSVIIQTKNSVVNLISYLFTVNFALLLGYLGYIFGLQKVTWRRAVR